MELMIISIASLKGGVGKTTITVFLSQAFIEANFKVLVIDLDHNNNLTDYYLRENSIESIESNSIAKVLKGSKTINDCIIQSNNFGISIIPATPKLSKSILELAWDGGLQQRFRRSLRELPFDFILIDTPPALCLELNIGIYASDLVLSPIGFSRWNLQGFDEIKNVWENSNTALNNSIKLKAIRTMVTEKKSEAMSNLEIPFLETFIPKSESIATSIDMAKPLTEKNKTIFQNLMGEIYGKK